MGEVITSTVGALVDKGLLQIGDGYRAKLEELGGNGPLFLRAAALTDRGFVWDGLESFRNAARVDGKRGRPGDVVITTKGNSVGRVGRVPAEAPEFVYSPHLSYWRSLDGKRIHARYLYYWTRGVEFVTQLRQLAFGTDMAPYFSLRDQYRVRIGLPPIAQQKAIADVLGALDDKIAANERVVAAAELLMLATGESVSAYTTVSELAKQSTASLKPADFDEKVAHYSLPAFDDGGTPELVTPATIKSNKFVLSEPCVLFSKLNPRIPRIWNVASLPVDMALASTEFVVLTPTRVDASVLWAALRQPGVSEAMRQKVAGTSGSHQRVRPQEVLGADVHDVRRLEPQSARVIADLGQICHERRNESSILTRTRDQLLPLLMSGKVRVKDAEAAASEVL